jgi:hypothetical protein
MASRLSLFKRLAGDDESVSGSRNIPRHRWSPAYAALTPPDGEAEKIYGCFFNSPAAGC